MILPEFARPGTQSLIGRLLRGIVLPMVVLALALGIGGAWAISATVESVNDRILSAASRGIADALTVEEGKITLELSPAIFGMLENNARDSVYYNITHRGRVITGYLDLPAPRPQRYVDSNVSFGNDEYLGRPVRIVAEVRRLPEINELVVVQVAETLEARRKTTRRLLLGLALLETALIGVAAVLLPLAVRWGLRPVSQVREEMDLRAAADLTPLPLSGVPIELRDLVQAFNAMLARLDDNIQGMRQFTADASHQMRTPLSILRTHVAVLRKATPGSQEALASVEDIDHAGARLSHLLVQLLALARADNASRTPVILQDVDLNTVAASAIEEHVADAVRNRVELELARAPRPAWVRTDPVLAAELVSNLVDNAVRYNEAGGAVAVAVDAERSTITVADDGPGISVKDRHRVFTRFARLDRDARKVGSGLGLPIAQSLALAIGAHIALNGGPGGRGVQAVVVFGKG